MNDVYALGDQIRLDAEAAHPTEPVDELTDDLEGWRGGEPVARIARCSWRARS